jgi:hypothetical protein
MATVNKLKNIWLSNDTTNLDGSYNKVSLLNYGSTQLQDTIIKTKLSINKNFDSVNDYKLDVSGNINFTGSLYQNGTAFTSGITPFVIASGVQSSHAGQVFSVHTSSITNVGFTYTKTFISCAGTTITSSGGAYVEAFSWIAIGS